MSSQANSQDEAVSGQDNGHEKLLPSQENNPRSAQGDSESVLNCDVLEQWVILTLAIFPAMRATLRAVSTFFKSNLDKVPLPRVYIPELSCHVHRISVKKSNKNKRKKFWRSVGTEKNYIFKDLGLMLGWCSGRQLWLASHKVNWFTGRIDFLHAMFISFLPRNAYVRFRKFQLE